MKRYLYALMAIFIAAALCGCVKVPSGNQGQNVAGDRNDDLQAIIKLADGTIIAGCVDFYHRWSEACIQIKIDDVMYTVHPVNVTLIAED